MALGNSVLAEADALLEKQRKERLAAYKNIEASMVRVEKELGRTLDVSLDGILTTQRQLEDECLAMGKNQVMFHQKTIRWKAEYKRFQAEVEELEKFEQWMQRTEANMHAICGKLEYVCHELNRTATKDAPPPPSPTAQEPLPSLFE
ncbi:hypothetical protein AC1031_010124 [Aphanomyces cochlioides]|nr:hypothetical protein AC1031_010124 [Aphanomyces cochlioides]